MKPMTDAKPAPKARKRQCCVCGADMGVIQDRHYDRNDTCGKIECDREMRDHYAAERDDAHERLDRDMGWS